MAPSWTACGDASSCLSVPSPAARTCRRKIERHAERAERDHGDDDDQDEVAFRRGPASSRSWNEPRGAIPSSLTGVSDVPRATYAVRLGRSGATLPAHGAGALAPGAGVTQVTPTADACGRRRRADQAREGLVERVVDHEHLGEAGDPEDLEEAVLGADQRSEPSWARTFFRPPTSTPSPVESRNSTSSRSTTRSWRPAPTRSSSGRAAGRGVDVDLAADRARRLTSSCGRDVGHGQLHGRVLLRASAGSVTCHDGPRCPAIHPRHYGVQTVR